jgi:hypothetical protein
MTMCYWCGGTDRESAAAERALVVLTGARHRRVTAKLIEEVLTAIRGRNEQALQ